MCLFDPALQRNDGTPSANLGDLIIQEAVQRELTNIFGQQKLLHLSTHSFPKSEHIQAAKQCELSFVGGTNLLSSTMNENRQWHFYQPKPNLQTAFILKLVLSRKYIHSVRDSYTEAQLKSVGIRNVLNTGCPTMWALADIPSHEIPMHKSENALLMLTDYAPEPELDYKLLQLVCANYKKVFVWLQGKRDGTYLSDLAPDLTSRLTTIEHSYDAFQQFLASGISFDYIGTRLHGGVKCLLNRRRSLVIAIDNRAAEIAKDTNLPTAARADFDKIMRWIESPSPTRISLNTEVIEQWRSQFDVAHRSLSA
jgi:Polysaccharide pyruvyl transferase